MEDSPKTLLALLVSPFNPVKGRHFAYLRYVVRHKRFVLQVGLQLGVPLWRLILHDWDKFLPFMWFAYARTFYGVDGTPRYEPDPDFAAAWNAHQKRNKHHYQRWILEWDDGRREPLEMPVEHAYEMLADWKGAGMSLGMPDTLKWFEDNEETLSRSLHPKTLAFVKWTLMSELS